jgi:hypothetical protein
MEDGGMAQKKHEVAGVPLGNIRNRNELRVVELMPGVLAKYLDFHPSYLDIQDIYALALNNLPPRYKQSGSIVIREPVTDEEIVRELHAAINQVEKRPTGAPAR